LFHQQNLERIAYAGQMLFLQACQHVFILSKDKWLRFAYFDAFLHTDASLL